MNHGWWDSGGATFTVGPLLKNYGYDGLGRLARTLSPYPAPGGGSSTLNRTEKFYYDGIRRIQELIADPVASVNFADMSGDPVLQSVAEGNSEGNEDGAGTPMSMEAELTEGVATIIAPPAPWLEREYVWGPGGGNGGVDELLVQYDAQRKPWWVVQDEGGDVVALCDLGAAGADGRVVAQFTYDAYGAPLSYDNLANHPLMHCGHKGLFVDRLDVGVAGPGGIDTVRITPGAMLLCHNRNRTYAPGIGRFLQADPNSGAMVLLADSQYHGSGVDATVAVFDMQGMYGDGASLYQYLGSSPWMREDPLGLSWDPFAALDEFLEDTAAERSAFLVQLGQDLKALAIVAATIASYLPIPVVSVAGEVGACPIHSWKWMAA